MKMKKIFLSWYLCSMFHFKPWHGYNLVGQQPHCLGQGWCIQNLWQVDTKQPTCRRSAHNTIGRVECYTKVNPNLVVVARMGDQVVANRIKKQQGVHAQNGSKWVAMGLYTPTNESPRECMVKPRLLKQQAGRSSYERIAGYIILHTLFLLFQTWVVKPEAYVCAKCNPDNRRYVRPIGAICLANRSYLSGQSEQWRAGHGRDMSLNASRL